MDFDAAVKETDRRMQESVQRVEQQMLQMQEAHQKLVAQSIAKMESYISSAKQPEPAVLPKAEYVTTDDGSEMLVMNMEAVAVIKNVFTLMQEVVDELDK